jgi:hypothetical protein
MGTRSRADRRRSRRPARRRASRATSRSSAAPGGFTIFRGTLIIHHNSATVRSGNDRFRSAGGSELARDEGGRRTGAAGRNPQRAIGSRETRSRDVVRRAVVAVPGGDRSGDERFGLLTVRKRGAGARGSRGRHPFSQSECLTQVSRISTSAARAARNALLAAPAGRPRGRPPRRVGSRHPRANFASEAILARLARSRSAGCGPVPRAGTGAARSASPRPPRAR